MPKITGKCEKHDWLLFDGNRCPECGIDGADFMQRDSGDEDDFQKARSGLTPVTKPSNPKDALGILKVALSVVPATVVAEVGLGMLEGSMKYGRHNYRVIGVRGSVYYDATMRHLMGWWEGEDTDPDSGLSHITKAITSLVVLRDAMIQEMWVDDRPPPAPKGWMARMNDHVKKLIAKYPNPVAPYTAVDKKGGAK